MYHKRTDLCSFCSNFYGLFYDYKILCQTDRIQSVLFLCETNLDSRLLEQRINTTENGTYIYAVLLLIS
jgi:hypothetical protein